MEKGPSLAIMIGKGKPEDDEDSKGGVYKEMADDIMKAVQDKDSALLAKILEALASMKR